VYVVDGVDPKVVINPFYWESEKNNSLYEKSKTNGPIELESDLPNPPFSDSFGLFDRDPKVSGKISIRGTAYDDVRLGALYVHFGDGTDSRFTFTGAGTTKPFGGRSYSQVAIFNSDTGWTVADKWDANGWKFSVIDTPENALDDSVYLDQRGHLVKWQLDIDTSKITGVARLDQLLRIVAEDANPNASSEATSGIDTRDDVTENNVPSYQMDVVPYITSLATGLNNAYKAVPSVFNRSALGYYPVRRNGTGITGDTLVVNGFNLNGSSTKVVVDSVTSGTVTAVSSTAVSIPIVATMKTGTLTVSVNDISSLNNSNNNTLLSNKEANGINNNLLNDDRYLYVWNFNNVVTNNTVRYPTMRVGRDTNQTVGFTYASGAQAVRMNLGALDFQVDYSYTQWYDTAVFVDSNGYIYGNAQNGDSGGGSITGWNQGNGNYANFFIYARNTSSSPGNNQSSVISAYSAGTKKVALENCYNGAVFRGNRVLNPKLYVTTTGTTGKVFNAYYDSTYDQVRLRFGNVTGNATNANGFDDAHGLGNHGNAIGGSAANYHVIAGATATGSWTHPIDGTTNNTGRSGEYVAVAALPDSSVAVVAWYDASSQSLLYSWNDDYDLYTAAARAKWGTNTRVLDSDFAGWYVDLTVDDGNGIHIAYYGASSGDLKYAYLPTYSSAAQICTVDSYLSVGTNVSISVKKTVVGAATYYVPYISYFMSSFTNTSFSLRTAWLKTLGAATVPSGAENDQYTGDWEVMTVPTNQMPLDYTVGIGIKRNGSTIDSAMLGYGTKSGLQTAILE
jgi:hypothetical protein